MIATSSELQQSGFNAIDTSFRHSDTFGPCHLDPDPSYPKSIQNRGTSRS